MSIGGKIDAIAAELASEKGLKQAAEYVRGSAIREYLDAHSVTGNLERNIYTDVYKDDEGVMVGEVYTNVPYAVYVELGTGPRGMQYHAGISPNVSPNYRTTPWYIHESQISAATAERYGWKAIHTKNGIFYQCYGAAAHPFLYPALKNHTEEVADIIRRSIQESMERYGK